MSAAIDLLVIGGGPAGCCIATLAARQGAKVTLLERSVFPRDKVCGEFVSAEGVEILRRLGVLGELEAAGAIWIDACRVTDPRGRALDAALPELKGAGRRALGVSRSLLDDTLLRLAASSGVRIRGRCEAVNPLLEDGRVSGLHVRSVGGATAVETLRATLVVAADGRRSVLARRLHPRSGDLRRSGPRSWFGLKVHLSTPPERLEGRVELHLFDGGYAGLSAVEGRRINLCLMTTVRALRACGGRPELLVAQRLLNNPAAREAIGSGEPCGRWKSVGPLRWGVRRASSSGALFVGDAAGTLDPFCGEGISNALRGAELAFPFAMQAMARGGLSRELARGYRWRWSRALGPVTRRVRLLGSLLERPSLATPVLGLLRGAAHGWTPRLVAATRTGSRR